MRKPNLHWIAGAALLLAAGWIVPAGAESAAPPSGAVTDLTVPTDPAAQLQFLNLLARRSPGDVDPWLQQHSDIVPPMFLMLLARHRFDQSPQEALEWFAIGYARAIYDAQRCTDRTAGADILIPLAGVAGQPLVAYRLSHPSDYAAAEQRALARRDLFSDTVSPAWICGHGLAAYGQALGGQPVTAPIKPPDQWPALQQQVRNVMTAEVQQALAAQAARQALPAATLELRVPHKGVPFSLAWTADGTRLATSLSGDSHIVIWDTRSGKVSTEFDRVTGITDDIAFTPNGRDVITSSTDRPGPDADLSIFDLASNTVVNRFGRVNATSAFALDPTGHIVAYLSRGTTVPVQVALAKIGDPATTIPSIVVDKDVPSALAFDRNGMLAVGTLNGRILFFDTSDNKLLRTIDAFDHGWIKALAFGPDGKHIAAGMSGGITTYRGADNQLHTAQNADTLKVFDTANGALSLACADQMNNSPTQTRSIAWSPDSRRFAATSNNRVLLIETAAPRQPKTLMQFDQNSGQFSNDALAFSPDGTRLAMTGDNVALIVPIAAAAAQAAATASASCH